MQLGQQGSTTLYSAGHYPDVERRVIGAAKEFLAGARTGSHCHARGQLIFAVSGLMVASTAVGTWVVPPGYALWVPPGVVHDVAMHGSVSMRTAYVQASDREDLPPTCRVIGVTPLLEAALVALSAEPAEYDERGRGGYLAALILDEVTRTPATPFVLPVPSDPRLAKLARLLIGNPASLLDINGWADEIGVSRRTLTRLFRAQTSLSFGSWRRRLRLLAAAARLADGELLARAAASVGYRSAAAFRAMAQREFGGRLDGSRR